MTHLDLLAGRAACLVTAVFLASCGGGNDDAASTPVKTTAADAGRVKIQSFVPSAAPIPADANLTGMWSPPYPWPLISVHAVLIPDGRVMTYGSDLAGRQTGHANYDVWDSTGAPDAGHLTLPNTTGTDLFCSSQLVLPTLVNATTPATNSVFIAGGDIWNGSAATNLANNNSNLFDSASNTLARGLDMNFPRWYSSSITLVNGETFVQGGSGGAVNPEIRGLDGKFRVLRGINTQSSSVKFPRNFIAPDGRIFGYNYDSGQMYFADPTGAGALTLPVGAAMDPAFSGGWISSAAMYRTGHILQFGGNSNGAYTIDITGSTPVATRTQVMAETRQWSVATVLADGKVVATSGTVVAEDASHPTSYVETWDPVTAQWTKGAAAQKIRMYHSNALLLPDGSVLSTGGGAGGPSVNPDPNMNNLSAEIYYPPYLFASGGVRAVRPTIARAPDWIDIGKTFGVDMASTDGVSRVTLVKTGSTSHSFNMEQRFLDLPFAVSGAHLTVQPPSRAGDAPPGHYLLFVFNSAGVPSVAKILSMDIAPVTNPSPAATPMVVNPGAQTLGAGTAANLTLTASEASGAALSFSAAGLPTGLTIDPPTGRISGTPTKPGTYYTTVAAGDGANAASANFVWTIQPAAPIYLASPAVPPFVVAGGTATYLANASGGVNLRYQWNFGDGSAATALSASPSATHTYAAPGTYTVTETVIDASGAKLSRSFTQAVYLPSTAKRPGASSNMLFETPATGSARLWVVNQDNDSVSAFNAATYAKLGEVSAGAAPRSIALASNGMLWVTNKRDATISVIDPASRKVVRTLSLPRGSQPFGIVMSPVASVAYVALEAGGQVLKFDALAYAQTGAANVGLNVRQLSITADGTSLYASRFVTPLLPGESTAAVAPTARTGGEVLQITAATMTIARTIVLQVDSTPDAEIAGRGLPNYLGAAAISPDGTQAWVPGKKDNVQRGGLRDGNPLTFQNTVRAISSHIQLSTNTEDLGKRIDHDNSSVASAAAYDSRGVYLFVALETSRELAVINAFSGAQLFRVDVGRAPQGLALSSDGKTLYVNNFMDRSVSVFNLSPLLDQGAYSLPLLTTLSAIGTENLAPNVLLGKQLFYDARDTRLARDSYMSCAACHSDGGHDGRVWDFTSLGEGLRNTIPLRGRGGMGQGFLHWSNNFDEVQDFEGQIRTLAGGTGLMADAAFNNDTRSAPLGESKAGISSDLDALAAYLNSLGTFDPAPARPGATTLSASATAGKTVFAALDCASCHSGAAFTGSGQNTLVNIGTLKPSSGMRLGGPLTGIDVPTLRDVWATAPYLHDGSAPTLEAAVRAHKGIVVGDGDLANLTQYLREIGRDEAAPVFKVGNGTGLTGTYFANMSLSGNPVLTRVEAIDFDWGTGAPGPGLPADRFSARWTGTLIAPSTGTYRFQTVSDDGVRLSVNGLQVINDWSDHGATTDTSAGVNLVAGQRVPITLEYYENGTAAVMHLRWVTPGNTTAVAIPATALGAATVGVVAGGLAGTYFDNMSLSGNPVLARIEAVDFDWGTGSPAASVPDDHFSARWTGTLIVPTTGIYQFQTVADDGVRLSVNGLQVIHDWSDHAATTDTSANYSLIAGQRVPIVLEYYENGTLAVVHLRWLTPGAKTPVAIPASVLTP
jgi:YVTN family beta-propeller protein